jgi:hypothetical protein
MLHAPKTIVCAIADTSSSGATYSITSLSVLSHLAFLKTIGPATEPPGRFSVVRNCRFWYLQDEGPDQALRDLLHDARKA